MVANFTVNFKQSVAIHLNIPKKARITVFTIHPMVISITHYPESYAH